jgi:hypothetical protein
MKVARFSALSTDHLYPSRRYPWYPFLLDADSTLLFHYCFYLALYSFCNYRMQFCRGESDLPRPEGSPLFITLKVISLFNLKPSVSLVHVDDDCTLLFLLEK